MLQCITSFDADLTYLKHLEHLSLKQLRPPFKNIKFPVSLKTLMLNPQEEFPYDLSYLINLEEIELTNWIKCNISKKSIRTLHFELF
eukprot:UN04127